MATPDPGSRRWAVILGASSGFGAATARAFAAEGWSIFGAHLDRRGAMPQVEALQAELRAHGVDVRFHNGNAADDDTRREAVDALQAAMRPGDTVGMLLHSLAFGTLRPYFAAGAGAASPTGASAPGDVIGRRHLDMTLDVMANSLVYWTQDLVARDLIGPGGRIYAMTSAGSFVAWPSYGAVSAAKAALEAHIRQLAVELAPRGITANAILAGVTQTAALEKIPGADEIARKALERNPHGRLTTVEDVARCLLALARPETAWLTGNVLRVDGGEAVGG